MPSTTGGPELDVGSWDGPRRLNLLRALPDHLGRIGDGV